MITLQGSTFDIVPVKPEDEQAIVDVYRLCEDFLALGPVATASIEMVRSDLMLSEKSGGIFCGIFRRLDSQMLGIVDFVPSGWLGDPTAAYLELLMIAAPYRRSGLGAEVVALVEQEIMRNPQILRIEAGVQVNNPSAVRFWQRMGYQIISGPELMPDGTTCFGLVKMI